MQHISRLALVVAITLTALALSAGSALAQDIRVEDEAGNLCDQITTVGAHGVEGGCHIQVEGEVALYVHPPAAPSETHLFDCHVELEGLVDGNGEGFFTRIDLTTVDPFPCVREACDEAAGDESPHAQLRWPFHLREMAPGDEEAATTFCLRAGGSAEGTPGTPCNIHLELTADEPSHQLEVGHNDDSHQFCTTPSFVSIVGHLETDGEGVEVHHLVGRIGAPAAKG